MPDAEADAETESAFRLLRLDQGVTGIRERFVNPWLRANIWLVEGRDAALLIDSGMGLWPLKSWLAGLVDRPLLCLSTHCHFDHAGGAFEFDHRLSHPAEATILEEPTRFDVMIERFVDADAVTRPPEGGFSPETYTIRPCPPTRPVDEGDVIDLGDRHFRVLALPGHSPGSIGVMEDATGLLFTGDALYDGELFDDYHHSSPEDFRESMARIKALPASTVHPGHFKSFGRDRMKDLADDYMAGRRSNDCPGKG